MISSNTMSSVGTFNSFPSLITEAVGVVTNLSFSIVFFDLISWNIPIAIFAIIITKNVQFFHSPITHKHIATIINKMLKKVKMLSLMISQ